MAAAGVVASFLALPSVFTILPSKLEVAPAAVALAVAVAEPGVADDGTGSDGISASTFFDTGVDGIEDGGSSAVNGVVMAMEIGSADSLSCELEILARRVEAAPSAASSPSLLALLLGALDSNDRA